MQSETTLTLHLTEKLRKKLRLTEVTEVGVEAGPHLRWYANLFRVGGVQYILTTNAASLYSVVIYGRGLTDSGLYIRQFLTELRENLEESDMQLIYKRCIGPYTGSVTLAKTENRSVLGSMNDMVYLCKHKLEDGEASPWDLSEALNSTPFGAIGYKCPREAFAQLRQEPGV